MLIRRINSLLLLMLLTLAASAQMVIDEVIWVVGDEAILRGGLFRHPRPSFRRYWCGENERPPAHGHLLGRR